MSNKSTEGLLYHFSQIDDFRIDRRKRHKLLDILVIGVCAVICGADDWNAMEEFGKAKHEWFKDFLELPNGSPSHDTFNRVFSMLSPDQFQECFVNWIKSVANLTSGEIIPIDGKKLRRSYDTKSNKAAIHMVSAWAAKNRLVLGQVKTDEKSNEITAIPELLRRLAIKGCIVTIDAMGCQKKIVSQIVEQEGDYVIGLKGNQGILRREVEAIFNKDDDENVDRFDYYETEEKDHGRTEIRRHWTTDAIDKLSSKDSWDGLNVIGMVESDREENGKFTLERRFYIASIENNAKLFAQAVRAHWGIENKVHYVLDVAFREDESRTRNGYAAQNLAVLRHIALNLLRQDKSTKVGVKNKRLKAGWDNNYLAKVLNSL